MRRFEHLKRDGKVRLVGVATDDFDYLTHFNRDSGIDVVQVEYRILHRNAERTILPYLQKARGSGAVAKTMQKHTLQQWLVEF
jgi:aryl-alcohol dehydrogenase-like predicted oxidoreductase